MTDGIIEPIKVDNTALENERRDRERERLLNSRAIRAIIQVLDSEFPRRNLREKIKARL